MEEHNNKDNPNKNKTVNKKAIVYHKLPNDKGALVGMCERDEECFPNATTHWRIIMDYACWRVMDTC